MNTSTGSANKRQSCRATSLPLLNVVGDPNRTFCRIICTVAYRKKVKKERISQALLHTLKLLRHSASHSTTTTGTVQHHTQGAGRTLMTSQSIRYRLHELRSWPSCTPTAPTNSTYTPVGMKKIVFPPSALLVLTVEKETLKVVN